MFMSIIIIMYNHMSIHISLYIYHMNIRYVTHMRIYIYVYMLLPLLCISLLCITVVCFSAGSGALQALDVGRLVDLVPGRDVYIYIYIYIYIHNYVESFQTKTLRSSLPGLFDSNLPGDSLWT